MRMMGANSVEYHRETVLDRGDDHPGQALGCYAERGESPLRWGGAGAARIGLEGGVGAERYEDMFGPGRARDPISGTRLTKTRRPGMELVVSAHKSVAELGVMSRASDMHRIMGAERDGTMAYLDAITQAKACCVRGQVVGMGAQGREMVNNVPVPLTGTFTSNISSYAYLSIFKRQAS